MWDGHGLVLIAAPVVGEGGSVLSAQPSYCDVTPEDQEFPAEGSALGPHL